MNDLARGARRLLFAQTGKRVAVGHFGEADEDEFLLGAVGGIHRVEVVAQSAAGVWEAHCDEHVAGVELDVDSQAVEDLAVAPHGLAPDAFVAARDAHASLSIMQLGRELDERRSIGPRVHAQGIDGLRLLVGAATQSVRAVEQKLQRWVHVGGHDFITLIARHLSNAATDDRVREQLGHFAVD